MIHIEFDSKQQAIRKWIENTIICLQEWEGKFTETYCKWAVAINGLFQAEEKYRVKLADPNRGFGISSYRMLRPNSPPEQIYIERMSFSDAADLHINTAPYLSAWGVIDLYRNIEDFIFLLYKIYLNENPQKIIRDFPELKKAFRERNSSSAALQEWNALWEDRFDAWRRKTVYKGIKKNFLAYCKDTKFKKADFMTSTHNEWAESLEGIALLRHCVIHGVRSTPKELAKFCTKPHSLGFQFEANRPIVIELHHLMAIEYFCLQLVNALHAGYIANIVAHTKQEPKM
ncbi:hypothetical protein LJC09_00445 [Desulfovibrio sp. OttesenSCG-928-F20]|nr:hypothetical protein [Desulfovibrio sp. OttesenSCG-928-F20]